MSQRTDPRSALLLAGEKLAQRLDLAQLTPMTLATEADVEAGTFTVEFGGMDGYLVALQQKFMTELRDLVVQAATTQTGSARLREGGRAYLDQCLRQRALRRWFVQSRTAGSAVTAGLNKQDQAYLLILGLEFKALRWNGDCQAAARSFLSGLQATAQQEHEAGAALPQAREALWLLLENPQAAAA